MTIDEAIKLCEEGSKDIWNGCQTRNGESWQQMAEWLKELKSHREAWEKVTGIISKWKDSVGGVVVAKDAFSDILDLINDFRPKEGDAE